MDENIMRVLQMLQDGKITAQEAEVLIASLKGEASATPPPSSNSTESEHAAAEPPVIDDPPAGEHRERFGINIGALGDRIASAISKVQPEKIVRKVQEQIRAASKAGVEWSTGMSARVNGWAEGADVRPVNTGEKPRCEDAAEHIYHLEAGAALIINNPLGDVTISGSDDPAASVNVKKTCWGADTESARLNAQKVELQLNGTDNRLEINVNAPANYHEGTVDLVLSIPRTVGLSRVATRFGAVTISDAGSLNGPEGACRVEVSATSGAIRLNDIRGEVRAETLSGDLTLERAVGPAAVATHGGDILAEEIQKGLTANSAAGNIVARGLEGGPVVCRSVSGDVTVERVGQGTPVDLTVESVSGRSRVAQASGPLDIKSVSGNVIAEGIASSRMRAQTVSGNICLRLSAPFNGSMQVNNVSGNIDIDLPVESSARVTVGTSAGDIRCEHDARDVTATKTLWSGKLGEGEGTINVQSTSGNTQIGRTAPEVSDSPEVNASPEVKESAEMNASPEVKESAEMNASPEVNDSPELEHSDER